MNPEPSTPPEIVNQISRFFLLSRSTTAWLMVALEKMRGESEPIGDADLLLLSRAVGSLTSREAANQPSRNFSDLLDSIKRGTDQTGPWIPIKAWQIYLSLPKGRKPDRAIWPVLGEILHRQPQLLDSPDTLHLVLGTVMLQLLPSMSSDAAARQHVRHHVSLQPMTVDRLLKALAIPPKASSPGQATSATVATTECHQDESEGSQQPSPPVPPTHEPHAEFGVTQEADQQRDEIAPRSWPATTGSEPLVNDSEPAQMPSISVTEPKLDMEMENVADPHLEDDTKPPLNDSDLITDDNAGLLNPDDEESRGEVQFNPIRTNEPDVETESVGVALTPPALPDPASLVDAARSGATVELVTGTGPVVIRPPVETACTSENPVFLQLDRQTFMAAAEELFNRVKTFQNRLMAAGLPPYNPELVTELHVLQIEVRAFYTANLQTLFQLTSEEGEMALRAEDWALDLSTEG
jgi:hypothetical protein